MAQPPVPGVRSPTSAPRFSVVVPALDEADQIEEVLRWTRRALGEATELIVVDGGSRDATRRRAAALARVLVSPPGRGRQLNHGAAASSGDVLVFLHADTYLSKEAGERILASLEQADVVGGCCRFAVHPPAGAFSPYRLLEAGVNLRTRLSRSATGDQAIFARRDAFFAVGGFPDFPLFEDVELVARLRRLGRFQPVSAVARTSRRRWERHGLWRTVLLHWLLRAGYWAGVPADRLARWYRPAEHGSQLRAGSRPTPPFSGSSL